MAAAAIATTMAAINRLKAAAPLPTALGLLCNRGFGSAAAVVQYDYDNDEEEYQFSRPSPMVDTEGWTPERGVQWVMIGDQGSRRHVFAERLSKLLKVPHISMGTLLSQELSPRSALYQQIASALDEGKLVPEEIIFGLLSKKLEEGYSRGETGFILNGIPRTRFQAEILDQIVHVDLVVNFKCSEENLASKNLGVQKFTPQEYPCMGSSESSTKQLQHENSESRSGNSSKGGVRNHAEECKPLEDYYKKQKKLINIEVGNAPGETWQGLLAALHLQKLTA